ncbi:MAG: hypothetical protein K2K24_01630, partial [Clostridia bacterium]|nr:hypothetical protein [Clostridia bacterium]
TIWTAIACVLIVLAVVSLVMMIIAKSRRNKAEEEFDEAKEEYDKNQKDAENKQMQMMLMGMMGGNANGNGGSGPSFVYQQPSLGADDIRGIVADTMNNMLPNVTQYLPQEASHNDELIQQLIDQNAQNEERIRQLTEQNEERVRELSARNEELMRNLAQGQEILMQRFAEEKKDAVSEDVIEKLAEKLAKQQAIDKEEAEKEAAAAVVNEKTIEELKDCIKEMQSQLLQATMANKTIEKDSKDEKIEMLMRNQEMLMRQMMEMSSRNNDKQIVMPYMPQPSERLMEKMIELTAKSAEKSVEKFIPVPVEKIVEKEVKVEVPVEKIVEKVVPMPVEKPAPKAKAPAPRLTLDEAYAKLSASQKKIFDTLKTYALSKDKCKENKSTYFTVLGQSSVNPLVKLTIKKNTTVALFKMEDEYMKDIRRGASSDGTKVKVKETEVVVGDNQALATAKDMIDLREDQIERYNDYLKEQRSMKRK